MSRLNSVSSTLEDVPSQLALACRQMGDAATAIMRRVNGMERRAADATAQAERRLARAQWRLQDADEDDDLDALLQAVAAAEADVEAAEAFEASVEAAARAAKLALDRLLRDADQRIGKASRQIADQLGLRQAYWGGADRVGAQLSGLGSRNGADAAPALPPQSPPAELPVLPHEMMWVPLARLDWREVPEDLHFDVVGRDDIARMMQTFHRDVLPVLSRGQAVDRDGLRRLDMIAGLDPDGRPTDQRNRVLAWDLMIGNGQRHDDVIVLDAPQSEAGCFGFQNGRHRALVARDLGWTHVPARVRGGGLP